MFSPVWRSLCMEMRIKKKKKSSKGERRKALLLLGGTGITITDSMESWYSITVSRGRGTTKIETLNCTLRTLRGEGPTERK